MCSRFLGVRMEHRVDPSFLELCAFSFFSALKGALPPSDVAKNLTGIYHSTPACKNCERYASELHISLKVALAVTEAEQKHKYWNILCKLKTLLYDTTRNIFATRFKNCGSSSVQTFRRGDRKEIGRIPGQTRVSSFMRDKKGKKSGEGEEGTCGIIYNG